MPPNPNSDPRGYLNWQRQQQRSQGGSPTQRALRAKQPSVYDNGGGKKSGGCAVVLLAAVASVARGKGWTA